MTLVTVVSHPRSFQTGSLPLISKSLKDLTIDEKTNDVKKSIDPELGAKITRICHKIRSNGIEINSFGFHFLKEFKYELDLTEEGFDSVEQLIQCLIRDNYPIQVTADPNGNEAMISTTDSYYYWLSVIKINKTFHLMDILADIPEDVIPCGQRLPEFQFPSHLKFNELPEILSGNILNDLSYSEVKLMSAKSPHEMYVHICGEDYHNSYHKLRFEMRFYDNKDDEDDYRIPALLMFEGLLCAARYPKIVDEWHRTKVLSIDRKNNCRLFLIDIGDVIEANVSELRLLLKRFCELPAQALKVQLTGIRPVGKCGQHWSQWAKNFVIRLENRNYCGRIECAFVGYRCQRYRCYMKYYDHLKSSNENELIFLHKILVDKELAVISSFDEPID